VSEHLWRRIFVVLLGIRAAITVVVLRPDSSSKGDGGSSDGRRRRPKKKAGKCKMRPGNRAERR
jgi:hypothetical protein